MLHVNDAVRLYSSCIDLGDSLKGHAFNVGGGMENSLSLLELFNMLERKLSVEMKYRILPPRESDQKVFVANIGKISKASGWKPMVTKDAGITKMLEWLQAS